MTSYNDRSFDDLPPGEFVAADRTRYAQRRLPDAPRVAGLDVAARAVAYGERAGLLRPGLVENPEQQDPTDAVERAVSGMGLITASGGVSYLTERTFGRLLKLFERPPWVATFVLRTYDYAPVANVCAGHGLVTERLDGVSFRQRRFASDEERTSALEQIAARKRDPSLEADEGYYHTELLVSRPADEAARRPLAELLADVVAGQGPHGWIRTWFFAGRDAAMGDGRGSRGRRLLTAPATRWRCGFSRRHLTPAREGAGPQAPQDGDCPW